MPLDKKNENAASDPARSLLDERGFEAIAFLLEVMHDENVKTELRVKAAESILDRAYGKCHATSGSTAPVVQADVRFEGVLEEWSQ